MACDAHATLDWPSSTECRTRLSTGRADQRDRRHRLASEPGRAQHFEAAHIGERVPDSSGRAFLPDPVLRCALRSRKCAMLRVRVRGGATYPYSAAPNFFLESSFLLARRHPAWLVWCLACSRVHIVLSIGASLEGAVDGRMQVCRRWPRKQLQRRWVAPPQMLLP